MPKIKIVNGNSVLNRLNEIKREAMSLKNGSPHIWKKSAGVHRFQNGTEVYFAVFGSLIKFKGKTTGIDELKLRKILKSDA